jgi:hypothetical protein
MNTQPVYTTPIGHGYTLRVYCTGDLRHKAAALLTAARRTRRQSEAADVRRCDDVSINDSPVLTLE